MHLVRNEERAALGCAFEGWPAWWRACIGLAWRVWGLAGTSLPASRSPATSAAGMPGISVTASTARACSAA